MHQSAAKAPGRAGSVEGLCHLRVNFHWKLSCMARDKRDADRITWGMPSVLQFALRASVGSVRRKKLLWIHPTAPLQWQSKPTEAFSSLVTKLRC